ncbi:type VI secretion system baseplate subunit TssE [Pandoraea oxalativorans]|uniref:Type VI secretion protein n=1 Tax=Pandoraea oxalativorans TaxID=573737 RepID=A0A0E3Y957_9BURK|nr:type VI secretion system baseplate subunit TssE [Pandoraea oxalativorans]AKC68522.1 type VI secretion protein [Pandoraea oxalativorans]
MTAGPSLYDVLLGHIDGESIHLHDDRTLEILSVQRNVQRILNTRAGALKHLPDYGLPDLSMIYRALPASASELQAQLEKTLLVYEPRIGRVEVAPVTDADPGILMSFEMTVHLRKAGLVRFGTYFEPRGVRLVKRPDGL